MNIVQALDDPMVFQGVIRSPKTWGSWRAFLKALFGLPMDEVEAALFRECTGRTTLPTEVFAACWLICGRRAGKSFVLALIAVFKACFFDYRPHLANGERATILVVATDRRQARVIFRYVKGIMQAVPALAGLIEGETAEELRLTTPVNIEIMTASSRTIRGYAVPVALLDEAAFWSVEGAADADTEIVGAIRPAMMQFPNAMMLVASSPHARRGALWEAYRKHHGVDDSRTLVWQAATRVMNPTIPQTDIDAEYEADPDRAAAEYGAQFRSDVEAFIRREVVEEAIEPGLRERARLPGVTYFGFVDPAGGSGKDSMTMAISHVENKRAVLDCIRETKPPFSPQAVTAAFAETLKSYGITKVVGDRYGGDYPAESFKAHGITYTPSELTRSQLYAELLPMLNSKSVDLLDDDKLVAQIVGLERYTKRGSRESIDHAPGQHDDRANSVAGALVLASRKRAPMVISADTLSKVASMGRRPDWQTGSTPSFGSSLGSSSSFFGRRFS